MLLCTARLNMNTSNMMGCAPHMQSESKESLATPIRKGPAKVAKSYMEMSNENQKG